MNLFIRAQSLLDKTRAVDFLAPLALRLYLVPVFWVAGTNKLGGMENVIAWFGNDEWGLGLPFPFLMAWLAVSAEVIGAIALLIGLGTRWFSIPLMITMLVAAFSVHAKNGWQAVADPRSPFPNADVAGAMERLDKAKDLLKDHGNYEWLTETGNFVVANNGMEWAITYFVMLLALFFAGAGKLSVDHLLARKLALPRK
ncbi:MAG: DoxX family protein [Woeseiaceae bacterium]|nr:DoxX family protein [Woeseiaceae bacterium]